ncbi:hypothetical protein [Frigoriflavimonas asaccharolytica]|uniref:Uncharacterized protein n=1 Tax=Frigoriflavimonas asaccharolytica TaxID=2735899 RepID=A0A8J8G9S5_9FLAO|nr:hypothetical protein [Frigoriflavimonas asaccharolytica]NRS92547.1 hypothetical protein [Frigoriflavimonas asaccharolytica]
MKKFIIAIICIAIGLWVILKIFMIYNSNNILSNQAIFKVYSNMSNNEIEEYFGLEKDSYDPATQILVCELPVNTTGFKPSKVDVNFEVTNLNCNEKYSEGKYIKYDNTELNDNNTKLYILKKTSIPTQMFNENLGGKSIISSKTVKISYKTGKINNIIISKDGIYDFCEQ